MAIVTSEAASSPANEMANPSQCAEKNANAADANEIQTRNHAQNSGCLIHLSTTYRPPVKRPSKSRFGTLHFTLADYCNVAIVRKFLVYAVRYPDTKAIQHGRLSADCYRTALCGTVFQRTAQT